jgi:hypothetical protein
MTIRHDYIMKSSQMFGPTHKALTVTPPHMQTNTQPNAMPHLGGEFSLATVLEEVS